MLDDGTKTMPCAINVVTDEPGRTVMEMTLKEGKNREIRRMCETVGLEVVRLKRNAEGVVKLGMLKPGTYRELTKAEINGLRAAAAKGRAQTRSAAVQSKAARAAPCGPVGKGAAPKSGSKPIYLYKQKESTCTAGAFFIVKCYFYDIIKMPPEKAVIRCCLQAQVVMLSSGKRPGDVKAYCLFPRSQTRKGDASWC